MASALSSTYEKRCVEYNIGQCPNLVRDQEPSQRSFSVIKGDFRNLTRNLTKTSYGQQRENLPFHKEDAGQRGQYLCSVMKAIRLTSSLQVHVQGDEFRSLKGAAEGDYKPWIRVFSVPARGDICSICAPDFLMLPRSPT